ncbi:MAG: PQQ-dependent sugar dehydrogenase [Nitrospiraceae bacterium]|nr:MAG: PQQ-dependent sugar dehydrogenase [Nitrospiraceae bacterium]
MYSLNIQIVITLLIILCPFSLFGFPTVGKAPQEVEDIFLPEVDGVKVESWAENLEIPWSLVFLPAGRALVSERPGRIRLIRDGKLQAVPYIELDVHHKGEGGLMGLAVHPDFPRKPFVYAMHTYSGTNGVYSKVIRLRDDGDKGIFDGIIIDRIPAGNFHNGGRIAFGPDRLLYITTGETFSADMAQDLNSAGGKILRVTPEGDIPKDNPFKDSPVYSYGHRNPQGLAWEPQTGALFESEHGPSGEYLLFANDEINIIRKGENYGWPETVGAPGLKPYIDPLVVWKNATPPSGITFYENGEIGHLRKNLFVATLKSEALVRIVLAREGAQHKVIRIERWFVKDYRNGKYGRIRDVVEGPDGFLYFLTNNRDGRGRPKEGDDRIYRILPE